jgi:ribosomal protein S15P/S13E
MKNGDFLDIDGNMMGYLIYTTNNLIYHIKSHRRDLTNPITGYKRGLTTKNRVFSVI